MKITLLTKDGEFIKTLTKTEIEEYASRGDRRAIKELAKSDIKIATTDKDKLNLVMKFLDLT